MQQLQQGVTPLGEFWIMSKVAATMGEQEKITPPSMIEVEKSLLTVFRFSMSAHVYSSNEFLSQLEVILKGSKRNMD